MDLGLINAGWDVRWRCEIDEYAQAVLRKHWPDRPIYSDIRTLNGHIVELVDMLAGGFPCQDLSAAGKKKGLNGERSGLWFEYARRIEEICPKFVLIENVPRLRTNGLEVVLSNLATLGYDAEWQMVSAASVGAPHLRERLWVVAWDPSRVSLPDAKCIDLREQSRRGSGPDGAGAPKSGIDGLTESMADTKDLGRSTPRRRSESLRTGPETGKLDRCGGSLPEWRIFDTDALAEWARYCQNTYWSREAGVESGLGGAVDGASTRMDTRPTAAWERGIPRSISQEEAQERRRQGEARSQRLRGIGNAVVPAIVEFIGRRLLQLAF